MDELNPVWKALADPTRRAILDLLKVRSRTTGQIADRFPELSRFGVMKHMEVLKAANLITVEKKGRERINHLNAVPIRQIYERWVSGYQELWASALLDAGRMAEAKHND